jgi:RHS repeat-associated protein
VATRLGRATEFLYSAANPIQTGVPAGIIDPEHAAVLRGRVITRDGAPLSGVNITIVNHSEFGATVSRADGAFDMAVNGGGPLLVRYEKSGFLPSQRQVATPWQDYVQVPDVALVTLDTQVTPIDLTSSAPIQVAQGSLVTDASGSRRSTLFFFQGTSATMVLRDGSTRPISQMHVRATEYTVGTNGPAAMPADLPPTSGYTYAVNFTTDEEFLAGAKTTVFSRPVIQYVENFTNINVGQTVPLGYYDRDQGAWIPSDNGRVIKILSVSGGLANLDLDGSGVPATSVALATLGVTDTERQQLATLYSPGQTLWRDPLPHFSESGWDSNWGTTCDDTQTDPCEPPPTDVTDLDAVNQTPDDQDQDCGSIIGCQRQTLGEAVDVTGTPFRLHYQSDRVPGNKDKYTLKIPLSGSHVPASLSQIKLEISVAGRLFTQIFPPAPNQFTQFTWDGKDAYGRVLQGLQPISATIKYVYPARYGFTARFGYHGTPSILVSGDRARGLFILARPSWQGMIGGIDASAQGLGGWSLSAHHIFDPAGRVLYLGDGKRRSGQFNNVIKTVAGILYDPSTQTCGVGVGTDTPGCMYYTNGVAVASDGAFYVSTGDCRIRRVDPDGRITIVLGNLPAPNCGYAGDGGPASAARIANWTGAFGPPLQQGLAVGPDGSLYIADTNNYRVRRIGPDGIINTVAGNGLTDCDVRYSDCGDGGPAVQAQLHSPVDVAIGPDGTVYISDLGDCFIRAVSPDGIISRVAGSRQPTVFGPLTCGFSPDEGVPATQAPLDSPLGIALGPDGSLYITESQRIRRVRPDGKIFTVAGNGMQRHAGDGGPATAASIANPTKVAVGSDGSLYIKESNGDGASSYVRRVGPDGIITTVAGSVCTAPYGSSCFSGDGGSPLQAVLSYGGGLALGVDGSLYIADRGNRRIRRITPGLPGGLLIADAFIPAEDGSEVYHFDADGRHLQTYEALTGAARYQFTYDSAGHLAQVVDANNNITAIQRDGTGAPTAIVGPFGQSTTFSEDSNGYLATVSDPANNTNRFSYSTDGLLMTFTDPNGNPYTFSYDAIGRLARDNDPAGGFKTLVRTDTPRTYSVALTTALNRVSTYFVELLTTGDRHLVTTKPSGLSIQRTIGKNASLSATLPSGAAFTSKQGPDPRFGMAEPLPSTSNFTTPGGLYATATLSRAASLADPHNPLSLISQTDTLTINGRTYTSTYSQATKTITTTTPQGRQQRTVLDDKGRPIQQQQADSFPLNFNYNSRGQLLGITRGNGTDMRAVAFVYDAAGFVRTITDPLGHGNDFTYDLSGRLVTHRLADGNIISYTYDANGNGTGITPPTRPVHNFAYTPVNLVQAYTPPDVGGTSATSYAYNFDRQLIQVTRPDGQRVTLGYDSGGRLNALTLPDSTITYTYDSSAGTLSTVGTAAGTTLSYNYDGSLETRIAWIGPISGNVSRAFDNNFRVTSEGINGGNTVNFQYDNDGLVTQAGNLTVTRSPQSGLVIGTTLGSITDATVYNGFQEPISYAATYAGSSFYAVQYVRDSLGRITQKTETIGGTTNVYNYDYDLTGRLTRVQKNGTTIGAYTYDANDNRLSGPGPATATYDAQDRVLSYGSCSYAYMPDGSLQTKTCPDGLTRYDYDSFGNLRNVVLPNTTHIEYIIDAQNRRVGKKVCGTAIDVSCPASALVEGFLYRSQLQPAAWLDPTGALKATFVYGLHPNVPDYMVKSGSTYRFVKDQVGSVRLVVDAGGNIVQRMDYDEFGNVLTDTTPGFQPFGFGGGLYDREAALVRFGARDYDPNLGRWTTKDPVRFLGGLNVYAYANGNPISYVDPFGLFSSSDYSDWMNANANSTSQGRCARWVRQGLEAGGADTSGHPIDAKDYAQTLLNNGFVPILSTNYTPTIGDTVVFQPYPGSSNDSGHIQTYNGQAWVSDFFQRGFFPGQGFQNSQYQIYRAPDQSGISSADQSGGSSVSRCGCSTLCCSP